MRGRSSRPRKRLDSPTGRSLSKTLNTIQGSPPGSHQSLWSFLRSRHRTLQPINHRDGQRWLFQGACAPLTLMSFRLQPHSTRHRAMSGATAEVTCRSRAAPGRARGGGGGVISQCSGCDHGMLRRCSHSNEHLWSAGSDLPLDPEGAGLAGSTETKRRHPGGRPRTPPGLPGLAGPRPPQAHVQGVCTPLGSLMEPARRGPGLGLCAHKRLRQGTRRLRRGPPAARSPSPLGSGAPGKCGVCWSQGPWCSCPCGAAR